MRAGLGPREGSLPPCAPGRRPGGGLEAAAVFRFWGPGDETGHAHTWIGGERGRAPGAVPAGHGGAVPFCAGVSLRAILCKQQCSGLSQARRLCKEGSVFFSYSDFR